MDVVTALSDRDGLFLLIEALEDAAVAAACRARSRAR